MLCRDTLRRPGLAVERIGFQQPEFECQLCHLVLVAVCPPLAPFIALSLLLHSQRGHDTVTHLLGCDEDEVIRLLSMMAFYFFLFTTTHSKNEVLHHDPA